MNIASAAPWDGEQVRRWLERRITSARHMQAAADKRGYGARDDYDQAAAEEWVCRAALPSDRIDDQAGFGEQLKTLLGSDDFSVTGIHDDSRFERHVRQYLRKLAKMTKANEGFANTLRFQP